MRTILVNIRPGKKEKFMLFLISEFSGQNGDKEVLSKKKLPPTLVKNVMILKCLFKDVKFDVQSSA